MYTWHIGGAVAASSPETCRRVLHKCRELLLIEIQPPRGKSELNMNQLLPNGQPFVQGYCYNQLQENQSITDDEVSTIVLSPQLTVAHVQY